MKSNLIFYLFIFYALSTNAQENKRGKLWAIGFAPTVVFDFSTAIIAVDTISNLGLTFGSSSICDTAGNLHLICNGFFIVDKNGNWILDGDSINTPLGNKLFEYYFGDGLYNQMSLILPKKNNSYYVFTTGMSDFAFDEVMAGIDFRFDVLSYHVVDMDVNNSKGKIVEKNKILMQDARLSHNRMSAVRHANGRDWWLVKPHKDEHLFYTFMITPDSIYGPFEQDLGLPYTTATSSGGQSCFSPDGEWYAHTQYTNKGVFVNKFDRCTGLMSNYHYYPIKVTDTNFTDFTGGVSFSPDNKVLYVNTYFEVFQIKLSDTTVNGITSVFSPDSIQLTQLAGFRMMQLAPNGRIYIGNTNAVQKYMTFIDCPNNIGAACNFKYRGLYQPYTNISNPPNLPFYGLDKLEGSPCDTIKSSVSVNTSVKIYPNPTSNNLTIELPIDTKKAQVQIYNMFGEIVLTQMKEEILKNKIEFSVRHLAKALYGINISTDGARFVGKFVKE